MATPRKHWCKLFDSILREDWDDATCATVSRLMAWFNQRMGRDGLPESERGRAWIGGHDAMSITKKERPHVALQQLARLPLEAGWTTGSARLDSEQRPTRVWLEWPKYAEENKVVARELPESRPRAALSETETETSSSKTQKKKTPRARKPSPASDAIKAFCEEYKTARGANPAVPPRDKRELGEAFADLGEERFRLAAREFLELEDAWIKERAFSARAFLQALPKCDLRAQSRASRSPPTPARPLEPEEQAVITSLFGGCK